MLRYGVVLIWPANGVLLAAVLRLDRVTGMVVAAAAVTVNLAGNVLRPGPDYMIWLSALLNLGEVVAVAALTRRSCGAALDLRRPRRLARFVLLAVAPACLIAALIGVVATPAPIGTWPISLLTWFTVDALGLLTIAPALLLLTGSDRSDGERSTVAESAALLLLLGATLAAVFAQRAAPVLFLVMLPLLLIAFRLPPRWAAVAVILVAAVSGGATLNGRGPIMLSRVGPEDWPAEQVLPMLHVLPVYYLFLAAVIAVALPASTVWSERQRLNARLAVRTAAALAARSRALAAERRIRHVALHDGETGLANRAGLQEVLACRPDAWVAALRIARFGAIRDAIGSARAAELAASVADRVLDACPGAVVARIAPDTLALQINAFDAAAARSAAGGIADACDGQVAVGGIGIDVTLSIGLAGEGGHEARIDRAQLAATGESGVAIFDPATEARAAGGLAMLSDLRAALDSGSVWLAYQPKLDLRSGIVCGAEALLRWTRCGAPVPPDHFIALAEETGFIDALTDWVVTRVIEDARTAAACGLTLTIAVNLSARSLSVTGFAGRLIALTQHNGGDPSMIALEVTESALIADPATACANLEALRGAGFAIAIDDYGAGQSSLAYLRTIPADEVKIDRAFVTGIAGNRRDALLVRSTVDLGHALGMRVVAEGVEDETTLALLALFGCDVAQGYHVGRPVPIDELIANHADPPRALPAISPRADPGRRRSGA